MSFIKFLLVVTCAGLAQTVVAEVPPPRPVADFATLPSFDQPTLSPDGQRIAARLAVDGKQALGIMHLFDKSPVRLLALGPNDLLGVTWVNDDWLAIEVGGVTAFEGTSIYVSRVVGVSADGSKVNPIAFNSGGQSASMIWSATDGSPRILMQMQKSVYMEANFWPSVSEVDVSTGRMRSVVSSTGGVMRWHADPSGIVRAGFGYNDRDRMARLLYRPSAEARFKVVDKANIRLDETLLAPILLSGSGAKAYAITSPDGYDALHELDLATLTVGKRVFGVDRYDVSSAITSANGDAIAGISYIDDRRRTHWLDSSMAEVQALLDKAVGTRSANIVSWSRDRQRFLVLVSDASQPGSYYFYNAASGGAMQRIAYANKAIKGASLAPVRSFRYKAGDGMSIEAILTLPRGRAHKSLPLIVMPHGGPEARDEAAYDWWAQFLADRGYAVVQPNYRGSTGYGAGFQKAGDGQWGLRMQDDLNDAVDHLAAQGMIDPKRVCVVGASYGGYAAMRAAQRDGARYRCAVSYAGVSDLNGMMRYDGRFLNGNTRRDSIRSAAPDLEAVSPFRHPETFGAPILIMHGKKDLRVPVRQSRQMVDKLKAAKKPVRYVEQAEGDHYFSREADRVQFLTELETFLKEHNPA